MIIYKYKYICICIHVPWSMDVNGMVFRSIESMFSLRLTFQTVSVPETPRVVPAGVHQE